MSNQLKQKTFSGLSWSAVRQVSQQLIRFTVMVVLMRILSLHEFGLIGILLVINSYGDLIVNFGLGQALIQKTDISKEDISTVFWMNVVMGISVCSIVFFASEWVAAFYEVPEITSYIQVLSITFLVNSMNVIPKAMLLYHLDFKKHALTDISAKLISGILVVVLAYLGMGIWSVVFQYISNALILALVLWPQQKEVRIGLFIDKQSFKSIFSFSSNLFAMNTLDFAAKNIDNLLVGKVLGIDALGYYSRAYNVVRLPMENIARTIHQVIFPVFSKIKNDPDKMAEAFLKATQAITMVTTPAMLYLWVFAEPIIVFVFTDKWIQLVPLVQIFAIFGFFVSVNSLMSSIFLAKGKANLLFRYSLIKKFFVIGGICITIFISKEAVAFAVAISSIISYTINLWLLSKEIVFLTIARQLYALKDNIIAGVLAAVGSFTLYKTVLVNIELNIVILIIGFLVFTALYGAYHFVFKTVPFSIAIGFINKKI